MNIALRDHKIYQMKAELENRKKILCVKRKTLEKNLRENGFLKDILDDYNKYNSYIIRQKEEQVMHLHMLNQYIENITKDLQLTDSQLKNSKQEQREIMREISKLKSEMNELIE